MKNVRKYMVALLAIFAIMAGCVSNPPATTAQAAPPAWVMTPPAGDGQYEFFVGSSSDASGDPAKAEEQAVASLIGEITRYIGVTVSSETTAEARASLDTFQSQLTQTVKQSSTARMAGFRVMDKFIDKRGAAVTVYLLGQYDRAELMKEKNRLAQVFQEQVDAVALPEQRGKSLEGSGDLFGALKAFVEAAQAASKSSVDNAAIKFERNINSAKAVLAKITLLPVTEGVVKGFVGVPFEQTFRLKVVRGSTAADPGLAGVEVTVSYKEIGSGGRTVIKTVTLKTDSAGMVEFSHPTPSFVGKEVVTMALSVSAYLDPLVSVPQQFRAMVAGLDDLASTKKVRFEYEVASRAKEIPLAIVLLETDSAGKIIPGSTTSAAVQEALSAQGFKIRTIPFSASMLEGIEDAALVAELQKYSAQVERVIVGTVRVDDVSQDGGIWLAKVTGTLRVIEVASGQVIYTKSMFKRLQGSAADRAIANAMKGLGSDLGKDFGRNLP